MKKDVYIIMAKTLIYTGANDFIVNKVIYIMENYSALAKYITTDKTAARDIAELCAKEDIDIVHLHGPIIMMQKLEQNIRKRNVKFKNQNLKFLIN